MCVCVCVSGIIIARAANLGEIFNIERALIECHVKNVDIFYYEGISSFLDFASFKVINLYFSEEYC